MSEDLVKVLIEVEALPGRGAPSASSLEGQLGVSGLKIDPDYEAVPMEGEGAKPTLVFRGEVPRDALSALDRAASVVRVWSDAPIEPFQGSFGA